MGKFIHQKDLVRVNNVDLSNWAFNVDTPQTREQVDVSGFNATGSREFLPGSTDDTITVQFRQDFGSGGPHQTLSSLYASGTTFPIEVMPDMTSGTSAANPRFYGTATMYEYNGLSGARDSVAEFTATFKPASNTGFAWGTA